MLQSTVARLAGIDRTEYVRYETGKRSPRPPRAAAIAKVLGVPLAELLDD
jgi:transcriptional regulator with XRE-family HTH domain